MSFLCFELLGAVAAEEVDGMKGRCGEPRLAFAAKKRHRRKHILEGAATQKW